MCWQAWHCCSNLRRVEKKLHSTNNVEYEFLFYHDDIKALCERQQEEICDGLACSTQHIVSEDRYQYLSKEEVLVFKDIRFRLHQREALSPQCRLSKIATLPILRSQLCVPQIWMPTQRFGSQRQCVAIQLHPYWITKTNGRVLDS